MSSFFVAAGVIDVIILRIFGRDCTNQKCYE